MRANFTRRLVISALVAAATLSAMAQSFPYKPIKVVVGFAAGGTTDAVARLYAQKMSALLNMPVAVA